MTQKKSTFLSDDPDNKTLERTWTVVFHDAVKVTIGNDGEIPTQLLRARGFNRANAHVAAVIASEHLQTPGAKRQVFAPLAPTGPEWLVYLGTEITVSADSIEQAIGYAWEDLNDTQLFPSGRDLDWSIVRVEDLNADDAAAKAA
ncbi:hypothetical protein CKO28_01460 [Rhodovibrio sodomensis]|uniref:Uncharacterized protein n=1 Tax=Rhodovibrio sodomensis TaxID=1088 RepID=A0ABS1D9V7_9PROT|nr:hypothetical protein [Rhodovibrio sodomensis]MBK1666712.1 hypothetical protein [Rhodovibrio sodomensis]